MTGHDLEVLPVSRHHRVVRYEGDVTPLSEHSRQAEARADALNFRAPTPADVKGSVVEP